MIDANLQHLQAKTFQEIESAIRQYDLGSVDASQLTVLLRSSISVYDAAVRSRALYHREVLTELANTRWRRLQQTQFMYLSLRSGPPRIEQANNEYSYLQEHTEWYEVSEAEFLENLISLEALLFAAHGEDEVKVYWRGWDIQPSENAKHVRVGCTYCVAYIYADGAVSKEPSSYTAPRVYNLNDPADRPSWWLQNPPDVNKAVARNEIKGWPTNEYMLAFNLNSKGLNHIFMLDQP